MRSLQLLVVLAVLAVLVSCLLACVEANTIPGKPLKPHKPLKSHEPLKPLKPLKPHEPHEPLKPHKKAKRKAKRNAKRKAKRNATRAETRARKAITAKQQGRKLETLDGPNDCGDTDYGAVDSGGDACSEYYGNTHWCGEYNDDDFTSQPTGTHAGMCCACGGGIQYACGVTDGSLQIGDGCYCGDNAYCAAGAFCLLDGTTGHCLSTQLQECSNEDTGEPLSGEDVKCKCGDVLCENDKYCTASTSLCAAENYPRCSSTDGQTENEADCYCGTEECGTGKYCFVDTCYDAKVNFYTIESKPLGIYQCSGIYSPLDSHEECEEAAAQNADDTDAVTSVESISYYYGYPLGCFEYYGEVYYNAAADHNGEGSIQDYSTLLCRGPPLCSNLDGTERLSGVDDKCACGEVACENDKYCTASTTASASLCAAENYPSCSITDGATENNGDCYCGTEVCTAGAGGTGTFCTVDDVTGSGTCRASPACSPADGQTFNEADCYCGTGECGTGKFCFADTCYDAEVNLYEVTGARACTGAYFPLDSKEQCEAAQEQMGWEDGDGDVPEKDDARYPHGCYKSYSTSPYVYYNTATTHSEISIAPNAVLLCKSHPVCPNVNRAERLSGVDVKCACGEVACENDMYCEESRSLCAAENYPRCQNTNGLYTAGGNCYCGTEACTAGAGGTGTFCTVDDVTGPGTCRALPACSSTGGATDNNKDCYCGTEACTGGTDGTGTFCTVDDVTGSGTCHASPACSSADGGTPNAADCYCGTGECGTGKFCFVDTCYDAKVNLYEVTGAYACTGAYSPLESKEECYAAQKRMGWADNNDIVTEEDYTSYPHGCYKSISTSTSVFYNTATTHSQFIAATAANAVLLCRGPPLCSNEDGSVALSGVEGKCDCGGDFCENNNFCTVDDDGAGQCAEAGNILRELLLRGCGEEGQMNGAITDETLVGALVAMKSENCGQ